MFPGIMCIHTLAYFYRYTVIKHQHLRPREDRGASSAEIVVPGHDQDLVACPDLRVCRDDVPAERVLPIPCEVCDVREDADPVSRGRERLHEPADPRDTERQAPVRGPDRREPLPPGKDLADTPGPRVHEPAAIGKEALPGPPPELEVSNCPDPCERTALQ